MNDLKTSVIIVHENILYSGESYIFGKNFTFTLVHLSREMFMREILVHMNSEKLKDFLGEQGEYL